MERFLRAATASVLIALPLSVWANNTEVTEPKAKAAPPVWEDVKKAPGPVAKEFPEEYKALETAANEYWEARKKAQFEKSYTMESEAYRKSVSLDLYKERLKNQAQIIAVRLLEVKSVNEKEVMVRASFGFKAGMLDTVRFIEDRWVREEAGWRHLPEI